MHLGDLLSGHVGGPAARLRPADLPAGALVGLRHAREVGSRDLLELLAARLDPEHRADPLERGDRVGAHLLVADQHAALGVGPRVGLLHDLGAVQPDARLPADQGRPAGVVEGIGALVGRPAAVPVRIEPGVDDVAAVPQQEDQRRVGEEVHDRVGGVGTGLLDDDDRLVDAARLGDVLLRLRLEAGADQLPQLRHPGVAVAVGEEVVALLALEVGEGAELGRVLGRSPGQRDRPPDAEVVADVRVVDRDHALELREHPQQPGAAAARRPEDPGQPPRCRYRNVGCDSLRHAAPFPVGMLPPRSGREHPISLRRKRASQTRPARRRGKISRTRPIRMQRSPARSSPGQRGRSR